MRMQSPMPADLPVSRRWVLRGLLAGGALALGGGVALLGGRGRRVLTATRAMMGTTATILVAQADAARAEAAVSVAFAQMEAVARRMTRYDPGSDVGRVNAADRAPVPVHPDTAAVVQAALAVARASDGAFDPALDRLTTLWGFHGSAAPRQVPPAERLRPWAGGGLYRTVRLEGAASVPTLCLTDPRAGLDLGGIAKGFAVDAAVETLRAHGIRNALVEAGGDLCALGRDPDGQPWPVGVRHPRRPGHLLATLRLSDEAAATSGDEMQHFEMDGKRYGHLIEPGPARPAGYVQSITVRAASAMHADALATAAGTLPSGPRDGLLRRLEARGWLALDAGGRLLQG